MTSSMMNVGDGMLRPGAVFELDLSMEETYPNGDTLPGIWVTEMLVGEEGNLVGRVCVTLYPWYDEDEEGDLHGDDALYYGSGYYDEAMGYTDPADHETRVDCFRAAEVFYRHAAGRGNAVANLCLGYVYSYDRCEGNYWRGPNGQDADQPYPREERAFECLSLAAEADIPEACYKLGDLYKHGTGCEPNAEAAFRWYARASELSAHERPVIMGSVALRLAGCYEEGFGCDQDFGKALTWYRHAVAGLEAAVEGGEVWYEKALSGARDGVKRCKQEL